MDAYDKFDHELCGDGEKTNFTVGTGTITVPLGAASLTSDGPRLVMVFSSGEMQGRGFKAKYTFETGQYSPPAETLGTVWLLVSHVTGLLGRVPDTGHAGAGRVVHLHVPELGQEEGRLQLAALPVQLPGRHQLLVHVLAHTQRAGDRRVRPLQGARGQRQRHHRGLRVSEREGRAPGTLMDRPVRLAAGARGRLRRARLNTPT